MSTNVKPLLSLLIISILICAGAVISHGENNTTAANPNIATGQNVTTDPNVTVSTPTPIVTPNITVEPNVTVSTPTPIVTPGATNGPSVIVPTYSPIVTPNVATPTPIPTYNTSTIVAPVVTVDNNGTQEDIPKVVSTVQVVITNTPTDDSGQQGIFGDLYDKIIIAAILGLIGLFYEILKIKYEHKQKAKTEKLDEDAQNKLLEKLERRQDELFAQAKSQEKQDDLLDKPGK